MTDMNSYMTVSRCVLGQVATSHGGCHLEVGRLISFTQRKVCCFCLLPVEFTNQATWWAGLQMDNNPIELFCFGVLLGLASPFQKTGHI